MTAAATHNSSNLAPGYKLDRYELLCPIAEGGMASVWVARQRGKHGFEKLVAIKTILPVFAADTRFQQMFLDEARIASRIEHANVAQILDLGEEHEVLYLAMEYVDGDALSKLNHACAREGARIPPGILLRILADTCAGLHEAHELLDGNGKPLQIVHRDVSPHNILVSTKGIAKLIDFGIAKATARSGGETNSGVLKGKIQYMSPEQALGQPVDRRSDIWAVGVVMYYLLSGKPPYEGENQLATLHMLSTGKPAAPLSPSIHGAIAAVVRKALSHTPQLRYQTAAELREAIEHAMVEAKVPTTQADVAAFSAKHLAERTEKRRQSVDLALTAAAERRRIEGLLQPSSENSSSGVTPPPGVAGQIGQAGQGGFRVAPAPSSHALLAAQEATRAEVPAHKRASGISELTPNSATIGSAALDASAPVPARSRKPLAVVALLGIAGAAATILAFAFAHPKGQHAAAAAPHGVVLPPDTPPPVTTLTAPAPPATGSAAIPIPVVAASELPRAKDPSPPPPSPPPRTNRASQGAPAGNPAPKPRPKSTTVDDGF